MNGEHSVKEILEKEKILGPVESYFQDETNLSIAKTLYALQKGQAMNEPKISLKELSELSGIDEEDIRERVSKYDIDMSLILDYRKGKKRAGWVGITSLGISYLEEEGLVDPHHFEVF